MKDYKKLVEALRLCQFGECGCGKCYYKKLKGYWCTEDNHPEFFDCDDKLKLDAAAAIEELQSIAKNYKMAWVAERAFRLDIEQPNKHRKRKYYELCRYDEAFTINEMLEETGRCAECTHKECPNCGAKMGSERNSHDGL